MASTVKFAFSKAFFAEFLCVRSSKVSFVIIRYDDDKELDTPGIKIAGIDDYVFQLEMNIFKKQSEDHTLIPAKIKKCGDRIIFSAKDAEVEYDLKGFHRYYSRYLVNSLIEESHSASTVPTVRKNKRESGDQILRIRLNKWFWSKLLHVDQREISYGIIKAQYYEADDPDILRHTEMEPVLRVKGVSGYYFSMEHGRFYTPEELEQEFRWRLIGLWGGIILTEFIPAKVTYSRNSVIFSAKNGEVAKSQKSEVYRRYMTRVANSWIL